jgi:YgiT-type zinc finger domain-containing protein
MICDICGKEGAIIRHITRAYGEGDELVVIERVPAIICPNCGESYLTAKTMTEIDEALEAKGAAKRKRPVEVLTLASA